MKYHEQDIISLSNAEGRWIVTAPVGDTKLDVRSTDELGARSLGRIITVPTTYATLVHEAHSPGYSF